MKALFFVAGTKGGVGKSTFSLYLANAADDLGLSAKIYDSDNENLTLSTLLGERVEVLNDTRSYPLDLVMGDALDENNTDDIGIVDMKGGTSRTTQEWFADVPWDLVEEMNIKVYLVGCITSSPDSVRTYSKWITYFEGRKVYFLVVKNEKDGADFSIYDQSLGKIFEKKKWPVITFPAMNQEYQSDLNNLGLTLREVVNGTQSIPGRTDKMQLSRMRRFYLSFTNPLKDFLQQICITEDE